MKLLQITSYKLQVTIFCFSAFMLLCLLPQASFAQKSQIFNDQNKVIRNKFTVQPKDLLEINTDHVKIVVEESKDNEVCFITTITLNKSSKADMENLLNAIQISNNQSGNKISYNFRVDWSGKAKTNNLHGSTEITLTIYAPKDIFYDIKARWGSVKMQNVHNDFNATVSYGSLTAEDLFGNKNYIKVNYGSLKMEDLNGTQNHVVVNYGNYKIYKAGNLTLDVNYSNGELSDGGSINLSSGYSNLKFGTVKSLAFSSAYDVISIQNQIFDLKGEMKYGTLNIKSLGNSCSLTSFSYSKITFSEGLKTFSTIQISASNSEMNLNIPVDQSFAFDFSGRYTNYKDNNLKITDGVYFKEKKLWKLDEMFYEYNSRTIKMSGNYGKNHNSGKSVKLETRYGTVSLFER